MNTKTFCLIAGLAGCLCPALPVVASGWQEKKPEVMVVSASRTEMDLAKVASSVTVIGRQEIEARQAMFVGDLLRDVPGLAVTRSGLKGGLTEVRIRGGETNQVVVMIDGVRANDPASGDQFQWQYLTTHDIEQIEIIRGPQSALWGADANSGVINIMTTRPSGEVDLNIFFEGGSYESDAVGLRAGSSDEDFRWGFSHSRITQDGFNTAQAGDEDDKSENRSTSISLGFKPAENTSIDFVGRYTDAKTDVDPEDIVCPPPDFFPCTGTGFIADGDRSNDVTQSYFALTANAAFMDDRWKHKVFAGQTDTDNKFFDDGFKTFTSDGELSEFKYQTTWDFARNGRADGTDLVTVAVDYQERDIKTSGGVDERSYMTGLVVEGRTVIGEALSLTGSLRRGRNSDYQDKTTWRVTSAYDFVRLGIRLRGAAGTGQKAPTSTELYGFGTSFQGNPGLQPEESRGWEIGIDKEFADGKYETSLTYFKERLEDQIASISAEDPDNPGEFLPSVTNAPGTTKRKGVEIALNAVLGDDTMARLAYTYLDTDAVILELDFIDNEIDVVGRESEVRRPRNILSLNLNQKLLDSKLNLNLNMAWTDRQDDIYFPPPFFSPTRVELDSYRVIDFTADYKISPDISVYGRINNLTDEEYEEVFTYNTPGRAAYAGVRFRL
ncbi:MAG: TonB-dependent receptor [Gammaproteobacteria bacterium]|nr:TonB-dependent receptor [Gammaproteobacteria bacterium]MDP6617710.1 TonB-dependent receptor [Gammaproteobacteria bacterium]MDP6695681.1 TonB-dependent receptor [Gammaproteobacteria bacterium]